MTDEKLEEIALDIHKKWLEKAETAIINGGERTVLPYGYLQTACIEAMKTAIEADRAQTGWQKYEENPLVNENGFLLDFYFLAIVQTGYGQWFAYCTINEGGDLEYEDPASQGWEPAPYSVEDIEYWMKIEPPATTGGSK